MSLYGRSTISRTDIIKAVGFGLLAAGVGFFGLIFLISDYGPGETPFSRNVTMTVYYFLAGLLVGYFNTRIWALAGLNAWAATLSAITSLLRGNVSYELPGLLAMTLGTALLGGYLGGRLGRLRLFSRLFNLIRRH